MNIAFATEKFEQDISVHINMLNEKDFSFKISEKKEKIKLTEEIEDKTDQVSTA